MIPESGRSAGEGIGYPLHYSWAFDGSAGKESACNAGDLGSIPGLGRSPGGGHGNSLQYSGLENSMDCIVHGGRQEVDTTEQLSTHTEKVYINRKKTEPKTRRRDWSFGNQSMCNC